MYYLKFVEGIKQPRILGGYSDLETAKNRISDHIRERGMVWKPVFQEKDDQWTVKGPDEAYTIWASTQ
jgi:hypothetical protein